MILGDKRLLYLILLLGGCAGLGIKLYFYPASILSYDLDPLLHEAVASDLKKVIAADLQGRNNLHRYCQDLKNRFPFISSVNARRISLQHLHIALRVYAPVCFINDNYVLLTNQYLVAKTIFNDAINNLCTIIMPNASLQEPIDHSIMRWIQAQQGAVMARSAVCIYSANNILVTARDSGYQFVCTCNQNIDEQCVSMVIKFLEDAKAANKKSSLIADIRFTGQIVLHKKSGKGAV